uniref:hypothetical protein n=1 Tax=uncultured Acinetobacter sp. TaxID=165433 RepID=UPI00262F6DA8|nr:hypothetical protein [uncultured Acinetobacter sp.]
MAYRSAITGRYVSKATYARHPKTTVKESKSSGASKGNKTVNRSAITGQFVTDTYAASHPKTTLTEKV